MDENYELILFLVSKHYPELDTDDMDDSDLYELFYDHYGIDDEALDGLLRDLLPLCTIAQSGLTEKWYQGFGNDNFWLLKREIKERN